MSKAEYRAKVEQRIAEAQSRIAELDDELFLVVCTPYEFVELPEYKELQQLKTQVNGLIEVD